ncbi:MAG: YceI family protein [Vicinamibacterales bacterium]
MAGTFIIDKAHSEASFVVRHLITRVRGKFTDFEGTVELDEANPAQSSATFSIKSASVDTSEPKRDTHLRSDDFFAAEKNPAITFKSARIKGSGKQFEVSGPLTIRGVSKEITLPVTFLGLAKDAYGKQRAGFEAEITLNRKDFGLNWNAPLEMGGFLVGDEVKVSLSIQAVAKQ